MADGTAKKIGTVLADGSALVAVGGLIVMVCSLALMLLVILLGWAIENAAELLDLFGRVASVGAVALILGAVVNKIGEWLEGN